MPAPLLLDPRHFRDWACQGTLFALLYIFNPGEHRRYASLDAI
jgi:hypothetical protein